MLHYTTHGIVYAYVKAGLFVKVSKFDCHITQFMSSFFFLSFEEARTFLDIGIKDEHPVPVLMI